MKYRKLNLVQFSLSKQTYNPWGLQQMCPITWNSSSSVILKNASYYSIQYLWERVCRLSSMKQIWFWQAQHISTVCLVNTNNKLTYSCNSLICLSLLCFSFSIAFSISSSLSISCWYFCSWSAFSLMWIDNSSILLCLPAPSLLCDSISLFSWNIKQQFRGKSI